MAIAIARSYGGSAAEALLAADYLVPSDMPSGVEITNVTTTVHDASDDELVAELVRRLKSKAPSATPPATTASHELEPHPGAAILRHSRENRGWSREDLAAKAKVPIEAVEQAERDPIDPAMNAGDFIRITDALHLDARKTLAGQTVQDLERGELDIAQAPQR